MQNLRKRGEATMSLCISKLCSRPNSSSKEYCVSLLYLMTGMVLDELADSAGDLSHQLPKATSQSSG